MKINPDVLDAVYAHARESYPRECCGVLISPPDANAAVDRMIRAENTEATDPRRHYVLGHRAHIRAVSMEAAGTARIAGYYHSHPDGLPVPSDSDSQSASAGVTYLIVASGATAPDAAAWRSVNGRFAPEPLVVGD